ncbi:NAD(P)H-dependent glycerol-3-phosphate dehydrogenase [Fodinicola acaciae]|uniref:NAD(P)H-dependent glycerol-3-phosphate dehydrogenase n=1 Tax=Fodinicola acaciae TaxID=2681555 RepID=UPI0013D08F6F|nr:NAD(P)H-dependent glycerol-3-phosphate dehydrogenase [Fodinicola acaciae]
MTQHSAVIGAGSWGTTFAKILAEAGNHVTLWARRPEVADAVNATHRNDEYLPGIGLPATLTATTDAKEAISGAELVVLAVPSQTLRGQLEGWRDWIDEDATLVSLMKGIELGTTLRMSEVIVEVTGVPADRVAVVSGPNLARELADRQPAATVIACADNARAKRLQRATTTPYFRPYTNNDVLGCELGGAVKNVIALACGMAEGMGFGDNTKATLITRGLAETARLGQALGADPLTFAGLAGLGDLVATCSSPLSRNHSFGVRLGKGASLAEATAATRQTAEGVKSCRSVLDLAIKNGVDMPLTEQVVRVCHSGVLPAVAVKQLMGRETKSETA